MQVLPGCTGRALQHGHGADGGAARAGRRTGAARTSAALGPRVAGLPRRALPPPRDRPPRRQPHPAPGPALPPHRAKAPRPAREGPRPAQHVQRGRAVHGHVLGEPLRLHRAAHAGAKHQGLSRDCLT